MKTCPDCMIPVNTIHNVDPGTIAGCIKCNADMINLYPRKAMHLGINSNDQHVFKFTEPYHCPNCGILKDHCVRYCEGYDYSYKVLMQGSVSYDESDMGKFTE